MLAFVKKQKYNFLFLDFQPKTKNTMKTTKQPFEAEPNILLKVWFLGCLVLSVLWSFGLLHNL